MTNRTLFRSLFAVLVVAAFAALVWPNPSANLSAQAPEFVRSGVIVTGGTYEFKFPGSDPSTRVVKRVVQGWIEVDAWHVDPIRAPFERAPRRWINVGTLEYIQEVTDRR